MGELYEAEDLELRERVALKTILSTIADSDRSIALFKREVHLARQVTHPNVCRIYDVFRHRPPGADGSTQDVVFLAMELLRGETLAEKLHRDRRFPTTDVLPMARQMAAGLAAAHRAGVVHRDFKSLNVMLVEPSAGEHDVRVVITDFGLARRSAQDGVTAVSMLTEAGVISGTPAYMAPEQVEGGEVTPATDVYAFGVVLYELVTGVCPFVADSPVLTAIKRLREPPPPPSLHVPDLDPRWEATILRCLARHPVDRFSNVLDVVASLEGAAVEQAAARRSSSRRWAVGARWTVAALILAAVAAGYAWYAAGRGPAGITSIAVLPFENVGRDAEQDYLSDGLSEGLTNRLSQLAGIKVAAHSSSSRFTGKKADPREVARALDVAAILTGRVSSRGDRLSISVELINGSDGSVIWGDQYVRTVTDLPQMPGEISRDVAEKLQVRLTADDRQRIAASGAVNAKAYELLLRGHLQRAKGSTEDRQKALDYFRQAIEADPNYALAYADLSDIYRSLINSGTFAPAEFLPIARSAAQKARELDDSLADAHYALANLMTYSWEWEEAEREYKRAIELNPNLALARRWYAAYLRLMGRHDQAIAEITRARQLDPLSPGVNATVGFVLSSAGRYDEASEALKKTLEMDRSYPYTHLFLGHVYAAQKKHRRGDRGLSSGCGTRSRHAPDEDFARRGVRGRGAGRSSAGDSGRVADGQGARLERGVGHPPGGVGPTRAGVHLARGCVSGARASPADAWRGSGVRSAARRPALSGSAATGRSQTLNHPSWPTARCVNVRLRTMNTEPNESPAWSATWPVRHRIPPGQRRDGPGLPGPGHAAEPPGCDQVSLAGAG